VVVEEVLKVVILYNIVVVVVYLIIEGFCVYYIL
jgi:hypothetical protein